MHASGRPLYDGEGDDDGQGGIVRAPIDQTDWHLVPRHDSREAEALGRHKLVWGSGDEAPLYDAASRRARLASQIDAMTSGANAHFRVDENGDIWGRNDEPGFAPSDQEGRHMHGLLSRINRIPERPSSEPED